MPKQYPRDLRERAVRMVAEHRGEYESEYAAIRSVAAKLAISTPETLRKWVRQAEVDGGQRPGVSSEESAEIRRLKRENAELRRANEILKAASAFFAAELDRPQLIRFIDAHKQVFGVEPVCRVLTEHGLKIAPSTYYAARSRPASARAVRDELLKAEISRVWRDNFGVYGAEKTWRELNRQGVTVARCTVARLMRALGLHGVRRGRKVRTTIQGRDWQRAGDLLNRDFTAPAPDRRWVADFTYVATWSGIVYVAFVVDIYSRAIVGWSAATRKRARLVLDALQMALWRRDRSGRPAGPGLIHHSDAGAQYTSFRFTAHLVESGIDASIGTVGDAYDNALMESAIGLCKTELIKRKGPWKTLGDVELATAEYTDWFNTRRLHGAIGHIPPAEHESTYYAHTESGLLAGASN